MPAPPRRKPRNSFLSYHAFCGYIGQVATMLPFLPLAAAATPRRRHLRARPCGLAKLAKHICATEIHGGIMPNPYPERKGDTFGGSPIFLRWRGVATGLSVFEPVRGKKRRRCGSRTSPTGCRTWSSQGGAFVSSDGGYGNGGARCPTEPQGCCLDAESGFCRRI